MPLLPVAPIPPPPTHPPISAALDDLELQSGRFHLRARQRGVDGAAVAQLVATLPAAFISLVVVALAGSMVDPPVGVLAGLGWLGSGLLVFRPSVEGLIARRLGMRLPEPAEAERLAVVWEQVTRRAGVRPGTYRLWVQDRAELNATATAGHIVGVTRHSLDRLSNAQLAAVLAHELGHHVGGHTWAGLLADWYSLPARTLARLTFRLASALLASRNPAGVGCGGCLVLTTPFVLIDVLYVEGLWWLFLPAALAPLFVTLLKRRAERRADDYAVGLGFGPDLAAVVLQEQQRRRTSGSAARPRPHPPVGSPPFSAQPSTRTPGPAAAPPPPTPHTDLDARLRQLQDRLGNGGSDGG
ncbi:M48 family metalloprotease [Streptomyces sp. TLI_171]|uniref:M48 family metalloprotease n=1 Tax=Streptomyces sp. TLI_171 TaxID=1938859 RepID=UPI0015D53C0B|nr:M48 family metalloprotease [Streptomyces sp. TLI_171]